jgi:cytochrome c oxidase subunit II
MLSLIALFLSLFLPSSANAQPVGPAASSEPVLIKMTAKKYEFSPAEVTVTKGQVVKIEVTALDRTHGIEIRDFNIDAKLKKDEPVTIEFAADREGEFAFKCSDFCGLGHGKMKGKLIVRPAAE